MQIGLVVLVGLACKNSILIVEFARDLHQGEGRPRYEATVEASRLRLRPILMTSFAFILGVVPLVIATGAGAEMRRSLGTAVFSGMIGVTLFGIFLTPVFFYVIQGLSETAVLRRRRGRSGSAPRCSAGCPGRRSDSCWRSSGSARLALVDRSRRRRRVRDCCVVPRPGSVAAICISRIKPWKEEVAMISHFFIDRPIFASVLLDRLRAGRRRGRVHAAGGPVSRGHAAHRAGDAPLSGGQRRHGPRHGGRAHRRTGQRRGRHDVHVVAVDQRRRLPPDA